MLDKGRERKAKYRIAKLKNYRITSSKNCRIAEFYNSKMAELQNYRCTVHNCSITEVQICRVEE